MQYLADLRLGQGRVADTHELLADFEGRPVAVPTLAAAYLAGGQVAVALSTAQRRLATAGTRHVEESRLREVLGEAALAGGDQGRHVLELGSRTGCDLISARGCAIAGTGALRDQGPHRGARAPGGRVGRIRRLETPLEVARSRMALAEALRGEERQAAVAEARIALSSFEHVGATRDADAASAWLRAAGAAAARTGPRGLGILTNRERDALARLGDGLSNPEIAERLYLSQRTVEHHVASVLAKLGLRNRAETAAFVARGRSPAAAAEMWWSRWNAGGTIPSTVGDKRAVASCWDAAGWSPHRWVEAEGPVHGRRIRAGICTQSVRPGARGV